jgi:cysteine desulfurase
MDKEKTKRSRKKEKDPESKKEKDHKKESKDKKEKEHKKEKDQEKNKEHRKEKKSKEHKKEKKDKKPKKRKEGIIYLDNNGTTLLCDEAARVMHAWEQCYNPSSSSKVARKAKKKIEEVEAYILSHCGVTKETHYALFTSGGTESNCFILRSTAEAYKKMRGDIPHFVVSAIEHHSILECLETMKEHDLCEYTEVMPTPEGTITVSSVEKALQPNTCMVSIMYANNELGSISNIKAIGEMVHDHKIPMHSDVVQLFGKHRIFIESSNLDAMSVSAHKFYGPKSVGYLIISKKLIDGYQIHSQIAGSQQYGLRGGTENVPGIASSAAALHYTFNHRNKKNLHLLTLRTYIIDDLTHEWNRMDYRSFLSVCELKEPYRSIVYDGDRVKEGGKSKKKDPLDTLDEEKEKKEKDMSLLRDVNPAYLKGSKSKPKPIFVILGPKEDEKSRYLPNTILIAFINPKELPAYGSYPGTKQFCNVKLKHELDKHDVVVSIASACLTSSDKASHVLSAIGAPSFIKRGVIRISLGDHNTKEEVKIFLHELKKAVCKQI